HLENRFEVLNGNRQPRLDIYRRPGTILLSPLRGRPEARHRDIQQWCWDRPLLGLRSAESPSPGARSHPGCVGRFGARQRFEEPYCVPAQLQAPRTMMSEPIMIANLVSWHRLAGVLGFVTKSVGQCYEWAGRRI